MILENRLDRCTDRKIGTRIADQVADHADVAGIGQFDQHHHIRTRVLEGWMHRVPYALPTVDAATARDAVPSEIDGPALMANPFGPELEALAILAALDDQLVT